MVSLVEVVEREILGGWDGWRWMEWMEWMETVTPVMGKELGNWVVMSVNQSSGGGWRWFGWMGWSSSFPDCRQDSI